MAVGTILTVSAEGKILNREPKWPWPEPSAFPEKLPDGTVKLFFPRPYYNFPLGATIHEHTCS